jgi:hypothetical protein
MMGKKTHRPKSREMYNLNQKAFLAINRAGTLQSAYMNLSAAIIEAVKSVEQGVQPADDALVNLMANWQYIDHQILRQFQKIDGALVEKPHYHTTKSKQEDWEVNPDGKTNSVADAVGA